MDQLNADLIVICKCVTVDWNRKICGPVQLSDMDKYYPVPDPFLSLLFTFGINRIFLISLDLNHSNRK